MIGSGEKRDGRKDAEREGRAGTEMEEKHFKRSLKSEEKLTLISDFFKIAIICFLK